MELAKSGLWKVSGTGVTSEDHRLRLIDEYHFAYGFETSEPLTDGAIVHAWSLHELGEDAVASRQIIGSRPKIQQLRASALKRCVRRYSREMFFMTASRILGRYVPGRACRSWEPVRPDGQEPK